jgi:hypothetical protein
MRSRSFRVERHSSYQRQQTRPGSERLPTSPLLNQIVQQRVPPAGLIRALPAAAETVLVLTATRQAGAEPRWPDTPFFTRPHMQKNFDSAADARKTARRYTQKTAPGHALCRALGQNACCGLAFTQAVYRQIDRLNPNHSAKFDVRAASYGW